VDVTLTCNGGLPLQQEFTISPGNPVNFTLTNVGADPVRCEVTETDSPAGYVSSFWNHDEISATSCVFETVHGGNVYACEITNSPDKFDFVVVFEWDDSAAGATGSVYVELECENVWENGTLTTLYANYVVSATNDRTYTWADVGIANDMVDNDGKPINVTTCHAGPDPVDGIDDSSVEVTSCSTTVEIDDDEVGCTIVGSRFFEGIPTLSHYGMAIMALLMLGLGFVGMRRFA
jgi:hypothetical protein